MPVPCCHLLSLVVTDIENVMHAYFGMTWKEREATVSQTAWSSTPADTSSKSPLAVRAAVGKLQKQRSYSEIGFSTAGIAGIDFERHPGWGRDCHRDSLQRSHSDVSHDGDFAKQEPSYRARHHGDNEQISDATASELSATPASVARASRKCHGCNRKTPRRLRVGRELYAEESVQLRAVQEAMKATDSLAVANSDASEMVCHVNHVIDKPTFLLQVVGVL